MQKKVLFVLAILFLSMLQSSLASAQENKLKSAVERISYHAEQYEAGNINYAQFVAETSEAQSEINALLNSKDITQEEMNNALGEAEKTNIVKIEGENSEIAVEEAAFLWKDIAFDGNKIQVKREIVPTVVKQGNQEILTHKAEVEVNFANDASGMDVIGKIDEVQTLAKTFNLDPNIQTANDVAKEAVNLQNLFNEYSKQSSKSCEETMTEIFGEENKKSDLEISVKQYEIHNDKGLKTIAEVQSCDNCQGQDTWKFIKVNFFLEDNGEKINRPFTSDSNKEMFEDFGATALKQEIINSMNILNELLSAGNYRAAASVMERIEVINNVWDEKSNNVWNEIKSASSPKIAEANKRTENFLDRNQFFNSLLQDYPKRTSYYEQQEFEKILSQSIKENGEEICANKIDDNANEKIDCSDDLCVGQVCGEEISTITEDDETTEIKTPMYCISGVCQAKKEKEKEGQPICGNKICETGEEQTCYEDCRIYYCPLEPVCIERKISCAVPADCEIPLCGAVDCVDGQCKTIALEECKQTQCIDGEEKRLDCSSGGKIISEICSNGLWKKTNKECSVSEQIQEPSELVAEVKQEVCEVKEDCGGNNACKEGQCVAVPINAKTKPSLTEKTQENINGISFTGEAVSITSTGITGLLEPGSEKPKNYKRPVDVEDGSASPLTGVAREEKITEIVEAFEKQKEEEAITFSPSFEDLLPEELEVFAAKGICKTSQGKTESLLTFTGGGESFSAVSSLQAKYQEGGAEWCSFELSNLLKKREEIESSFNNDFARWFFEEHLAKAADNWEQKEEPIEEIYWQVIENQIQTAKMMECSGMRELAEYHPIQINYQSELGNLEYTETIEFVKLPGMSKEVRIITPNIKMIILPNKDFIISELKKAMKTYSFLGSSETAAERGRLGGLVAEEKQMIFNNQDILDKINKISGNYKDGKIDIQIRIDDGEETIYNLYARAGSEDIRAQPMPPEETPSTDIKITIPFSDIYELVKKSMEHTYERKAPWNNGLSVAERAKSITNWISMWINTRNLMNSIAVLPEKESGDIKDLIKQIFFIIEEDKSAENKNDLSVNKEITIWNSRGDVKKTIN
ncbi:hypothetical protein HYT23_03460 [Candidatus Pacearchaeota archaeon]|nr:hypothetical protein [Candidatus Pacearchaeota archaeon]